MMGLISPIIHPYPGVSGLICYNNNLALLIPPCKMEPYSQRRLFGTIMFDPIVRRGVTIQINDCLAIMSMKQCQMGWFELKKARIKLAGLWSAGLAIPRLGAGRE